jgi:hypothetical protein
MTHFPANTFRHTDLGEYSADASDLGLAPGQWPTSFTVEINDVTYTATDPRPKRDREGDTTHVEYTGGGHGLNGMRFRIWND